MNTVGIYILKSFVTCIGKSVYNPKCGVVYFYNYTVLCIPLTLLVEINGG